MAILCPMWHFGPCRSLPTRNFHHWERSFKNLLILGGRPSGSFWPPVLGWRSRVHGGRCWRARFVCWQSLRVWGRDFVVRNLDAKDTKIVVPLGTALLKSWRFIAKHGKLGGSGLMQRWQVFFWKYKLQKNLPEGSTVSQKISFAQFHGNSVTRLGPISHSWDLQKTKACKKRFVKPGRLHLVVGDSKHDFHISGMIISNIPKWSVNTPTIPNTSLWMIIWILGDDYPKFRLIRWFLME